MKLTVLLYWFMLLLYLKAKEITNEELAIVVHRLVGDVSTLKQVAKDQSTILHKQDQVITAVQSSVSLFTQVAAQLQKTVASLDGKLGEQISDIKSIKKSIVDVKSENMKSIANVTSEIKKSIDDVKSENIKSIANVTSEIKKSLGDVKSENIKAISNVKSEMKKSIHDVKSEVKKSIDDVKSENIKSIAKVTSAVQHVEHTQTDIEKKVKYNEHEITASKSKMQDAESKIRDLKANQEHVVQNFFPKYSLQFIGIGWYKKQSAEAGPYDRISFAKCIEVCYKKRQESSKWNGISYRPEGKRCYCYANDQGHEGAMHGDYYSQWLHYRFN